MHDLKLGCVEGPGAYKTPIDHYHTQKVCPGPSISSSGLRTIYTKSPADYWAFSELNPDRFEKPPSDALSFGRAAHALLLGDEVFEEQFIVMPKDAPPLPTITQIRAAEKGKISPSYLERSSFWKGFYAKATDKTVVRNEWMETIGHMAEALHRHPLVNPLFVGQAEVSLIWQDEQTGVWLKARPDMIPEMGGTKADLKTTADASLRAVMRDISKHGYDMQAALGALGQEIVLGETGVQEVLVFVQKTAPFHVTAVEISQDAIHWGKLKLRKAIDTFAHCLETGDWPGPVEGIPLYDQPDWELHQMGEAQALGEFPNDFFATEESENDE